MCLLGCNPNAPSGNSEKPNNCPTFLCSYINANGCRETIYLAPKSEQIEHIVLSVYDTPDYDIAGDYRVPNRKEAELMHLFTIPDAGSERYLCLDLETETWYSFQFGSGNVTKAGMKTKYTMRSIRTYVEPKVTLIEL